MPIRLVALDLDGSALDSRGALRERVRLAVARAREADVQVVACTGRRLRTAAPRLRELGLSGAAIVQNGVLVKEAASGATLLQRQLAPELYRRALQLLREVGPPVVYVDAPDRDFYVEASAGIHPFQRDYLEDHGRHGSEVASLDVAPDEAILVMSAMAEHAVLDRLRARVHALLGQRVRTHLLENKSYRGHILEVLSPGAGKWPALRWLCERRGIDPREVLAIGDEQNDAEMIACAGVGVAMGNATDSVKAVADEVTADNDDDGAARAIERHVFGEA